VPRYLVAERLTVFMPNIGIRHCRPPWVSLRRPIDRLNGGIRHTRHDEKRRSHDAVVTSFQ
jgi:hypothetical protein